MLSIPPFCLFKTCANSLVTQFSQGLYGESHQLFSIYLTARVDGSKSRIICRFRSAIAHIATGAASCGSRGFALVCYLSVAVG